MPDVREGNAHRRIERRLLRHLRLWEKRVRVHFGATAPRTIRKPWLDEPFPTTTPNRVLRHLKRPAPPKCASRTPCSAAPSPPATAFSVCGRAPISYQFPISNFEK
jgi:hypothetical protein